ncbi:MAG: anaerobic selenocysteine-containing dehydrogenase [Hyphomicrobiaceae bacterium]|jgi:anaerobic selenocysteine-containing dehydrogenase
MSTHHRTCNLCEAHCGILIDVDDGQVGSIRGDAADPLSQGYICPKATGLKDLWEDPDRIRRPMVRAGETWSEVSWDEGIDAAARGIHGTASAHGLDSVGSYAGNPNAHNLMSLLALAPFLRLLGSHNRFSASTVDQFPKMLACYLLYGGQLAIPVPDIDRTDYFLVLGANPMVSNGSLMTAPGMRRRIRELKERGGRMVVVDPRRSETADVATEHVFIRPGGDPHFLLGMLHTIFTEGLVDLGRLGEQVQGLEHVRELVAPFAPEVVAGASGVGADDIRRLAREFAGAPSAACYLRIGTCVQDYGTLANYLGEVLNIVCGRLDSPGGVMWPHAAVGGASRGHYKRWNSRVRSLPEFGGELPTACLAEEIETDGAGQIHALVTVAGNPVLSTPNGNRLDAALASLDFMVSVDPALNETTRHADVILPPRHSFENPQYSIVFHKLAVHDTTKFCLPLFEPASESLSEFEILGRLSAKLVELRNADLVAGGGEPQPNPTAATFAASPTKIIEMMLEAGPYDVTMDDLLANPSGIDLGDLKPDGVARNVCHEGGKVHLAHTEIDSELARLAADLALDRIGSAAITMGRDGDNGFLMIGRRQLRSNNSWMHNCPTLMKGEERCTLTMNPDDAGRLGLKHGLMVRVESRVGAVEIQLRISDEMMPGVVSMPHGFGHGRPGTRMSVAARRPGVSMNDLTDETTLEGLVGNGVLTGVPVRVSAFEAASV